MNSLVSVLVPVYNVEDYIVRCAESLFNQTYDNIEFVFVDDASPDNSIQRLLGEIEKHPKVESFIRIIRHNKNKGLSVARNTGLQNATGDYVMFVDSDDFIDENTISTCMKYALEEDADIVSFGIQDVFEDGTKIPKRSSPIPQNKKDYIRKLICRDINVNACGNLFRRSLFTKGNIAFIEGIDYGEDFVTTPRIVMQAERIIDITNHYYYNYYQDNSTAYTRRYLNRKSINSIIKAVKILESFLREKFHDVDDMINEMKIRNKIFLFEYAASNEWDYIRSTFEEVDGININMPLKHRVVWRLYCLKQYALLKLYICSSRRLRRIITRISK